MSELMKWSGSKNSQSKKIISNFPKKISTYFEPFLGGASVFLELLESDIKIDKFFLSDINSELIGIYKLIKENPSKIIDKYKEHYINFNNGDVQRRKDYFKEIKSDFNLTKNSEDFYWIMRTTTSGLPRYNQMGMFNNSCHFSRPGMTAESVEKIIMKYHKLFNDNNIEFHNLDYKIIESTNTDDLIYFDPPYQNTKGMYFNNFNNFEFINWLNNLKCKWILSYDGKINDEKVDHISPIYKRHEYLLSGNSSFRRVVGKTNDTIISESLYLNF
jgi:DNA adenine methylase